jgi:hypothetical protein
MAPQESDPQQRGFSVEVPGRFAIIYREEKRTMAIAAEMTMDGFVINVSSIGHWQDDPSQAVDARKRDEIIANVKHALESQGERIELVGTSTD